MHYKWNFPIQKILIGVYEVLSKTKESASIMIAFASKTLLNGNFQLPFRRVLEAKGHFNVKQFKRDSSIREIC